MPALFRRGIAGISALDSRVDLIARATRRPEHNDYIVTRRPPTSKLEGHQMMTFRSGSSSSGSRPKVGTRAPEVQHSAVPDAPAADLMTRRIDLMMEFWS